MMHPEDVSYLNEPTIIEAAVQLLESLHPPPEITLTRVLYWRERDRLIFRGWLNDGGELGGEIILH